MRIANRVLWTVVLAAMTAGCGPATVTLGDPSASCWAVDRTVCSDVAAYAIDNLGLSPPHGALSIFARPSCPPVEDWPDGSRCWQVYIPLGNQTMCMMVAKRRTGDGYGQVAGDVPGRAAKPGDLGGCP